MRSSYKRIGDYIQLVDERNRDLSIDTLLGLSVDKRFIPSVANTVGSNMANYKIIRKGQFACSLMQVRRDKKIPVAMLKDYDAALISQAYPVFEVKNKNELLAEYLMMWMSRSEFDREACFYAIGGVRGNLEWEDFCNMRLPVPSIDKQREIVQEYYTIIDRIKLNEQFNQKLEEAAQAIYKQWFVDFEFPISKDYATKVGKLKLEGQPYKFCGGKMVWNDELDQDIPEGWEVSKIESIATLKYGKMLDSSLFEELGHPVFSGYGIRGYYHSYMYEKPQILVLCRGVSGTGEVRMSPAFSHITNLSIIVEINESAISKSFAFYYLKNDNLRKLDSGSAQSQITAGDLGYHKILRPSYELQLLFDESISKFHSYTSILNKAQLNLNTLRTTVLSKMTKVEAAA